MDNESGGHQMESDDSLIQNSDIPCSLPFIIQKSTPPIPEDQKPHIGVLVSATTWKALDSFIRFI